MNTEAQNRYFQELTLNLQHEGFTVKPKTGEDLLPVELDGRHLCLTNMDKTTKNMERSC